MAKKPNPFGKGAKDMDASPDKQSFPKGGKGGGFGKGAAKGGKK